MGDASTTNVSAMTDGTESYAMQNFVILVVTNMDSVKMELVCVSQAGTESTALLKDVREGKSFLNFSLKFY